MIIIAEMKFLAKVRSVRVYRVTSDAFFLVSRRLKSFAYFGQYHILTYRLGLSGFGVVRITFNVICTWSYSPSDRMNVKEMDNNLIWITVLWRTVERIINKFN